jgi:PAS domain-containing protein
LDATLVDDDARVEHPVRSCPYETCADAHNEAERFRFQWLVENSASLIAFADVNGKVTFMNRAGRELTGYEGDASRLSLHHYSLEEVISTSGAAIGLALAEAGQWSGELVLPAVDSGSPTPVWVDIMLLPDPAEPDKGSLAVIARPLGERPDVEGASFLAPDGTVPYLSETFAELVASPGSMPVDTGGAKSRRRERLQKLALDTAQRGLDLGPRGFVAELTGTLAEITAELKVDIVYVDSFDEVSGRAIEVGAFLRPGLVDGGADSPDLNRLPAWISDQHHQLSRREGHPRREPTVGA